MTYTDDAEDVTFPTNTPAQAESLLNSKEQAVGGIDLYANPNIKEFMYFNQEGAIST